MLAEIDVPELEQEFQQKRALVAQSKAEAAQATQALAAADANIGALKAKENEAKAGVGRATALVDRWLSESKRTADLAKTGVLDTQAAEETRNQYRSAEASLDEAKARVVAAEASVRKAVADRNRAAADVTTAEARIAVAEADARRVEVLYRYRFVRAPFDGIVTRRRVNTGHYLAPAQGKGEGLFVVAKLDPVRLVFNVPEASSGWIAEGSEVEITVQAARGLHLTGKVNRTSWSLDPGSRTLRAEIDMPNGQGQLRPGMYLYAHIAADLPKEWTLPVGSVVKQGEEYVCFILDGDKARRTVVEIGHTYQGHVECPRRRETTGAWVAWAGGERVASKAAGLADGQTVTIEP
ncbi:MAG: efflux RND transporter periplasmic adaptor subunit [Gemmataceae bacterium]